VPMPSSTPNTAPASIRSYARASDVLAVPNLIQIQVDSYKWFQTQGINELFQEVSPIKSASGKMELHFLDCEFLDPKYSEPECREKDLSFVAPLRVKARLVLAESGEIKEQPLFLGDFPLISPQGTFIINGTERVVVSQLQRSPGVYFTVETDASTDRQLCYAKLIPSRGAWLEFETTNRDNIVVKVDRKRRIPLTTLLRAIGYSTDEEILALFQDVDTDPQHNYIKATLDRDPTVKTEDEAILDLYKRLRPTDPPNLENAKSLLYSLLFNPRRYDLGRVGRHKLNKRLRLDLSLTQRVLTKEDLVAIGRHIIMVNNGHDRPDDIDHLGNRRIRAVGELIQNQFRVGLLRLERMVKDRMSLVDPETATPSSLVNIRPLVAAIREFFGGSQLSQFMDQTNPLAELTHKRRLSALGPGGLSRERAGFDVRDVHHSHYGRICPIETPEGPNIGLIGSLATYARINEFGFIEAPYRRVLRELPSTSPELMGRTIREDVADDKGKVVARAGTEVTAELVRKLAKLSDRAVAVKPFVTDEVQYLTADEEESHVIAQANAVLDDKNQLVEDRVEARRGNHFTFETPDKIDDMDVSPKQIVSVATSLIPFLEHDDANRALMGSNMQRQAMPLLRPEAPLVSTGMEGKVAHDSGHLVVYGEGYCQECSQTSQQPCQAKGDGEVVAVTARKIDVREKGGKLHSYPLKKFFRSNQGTCINHRASVDKGQRILPGHLLADSSSTQSGELALGQDVLCAFMSWEGYNFEDAIVISQNLARRDKFTSIHIEKHEVEARDTKLGPEEITRDIPNVGEESLRNLDEEGIIRVGAEVGPGDILVGKITPKGETELTSDERLLRAIFGEKAREVKDTSLRVPHGEYGKVIEVTAFSRESNRELPPGVNKVVRVCIAQLRKISEGDKIAGRHGNKGVIAKVLPEDDMPYLPDGRPVDIVLNPIGVPSRMNIGQILETHLGWAAQELGYRAISPVFQGASDTSIEDALGRMWILRQAGALDGRNGHNGANKERAKAWLTERGIDADSVLGDGSPGAAREACLRLWLQEMGESAADLSLKEMEKKAQLMHREKGLAPPIFGKTILYDGRTGEPFDQPVTVGCIYLMKLIHQVEDKIHARSTGPYSLITQQPLGGKAQFGGQRFGEMEVWALEAYGAAHILQELLTVKSDDVVGRVKTYEAIVKGEDVGEVGVPESFKVLVKELNSLGLAVEALNEEEEKISLLAEATSEVPELGINLSGFEERE